jgi:hypothetical protein
MRQSIPAGKRCNERVPPSNSPVPAGTGVVENAVREFVFAAALEFGSTSATVVSGSGWWGISANRFFHVYCPLATATREILVFISQTEGGMAQLV